MNIIPKGSGPKRGRIVVLYGRPHAGKSRGAVTWPKPLLIPIESDPSLLDHVDAFDRCKTSDDVYACFKQIADAGDNLEYETIIVDSYTAFCHMVGQEWCEDNKKPSVAYDGYNKGETAVLTKHIQKLLNAIEWLKDQGITIVLTGHECVVAVKNSEGVEFGKTTVAPHRLYADAIVGLADEVVHMTTDKVVTGGKDGRGGTVRSSGTRIARLDGTPAYDAKGRHDSIINKQFTIPEFKSQAENNLWELIYNQTQA